jgi:hypothetical protein
MVTEKIVTHELAEYATIYAKRVMCIALRTCNMALSFVLAFYPFSFPAKLQHRHLFGQSCILHCQSPPSPDIYTANRFVTLLVLDAKPPMKHRVLLHYT